MTKAIENVFLIGRLSRTSCGFMCLLRMIHSMLPNRIMLAPMESYDVGIEPFMDVGCIIVLVLDSLLYLLSTPYDLALLTKSSLPFEMSWFEGKIILSIFLWPT